MGFGLDLNIKVEAPKIEAPKVDVAAATKDVMDSAKATVASATGALGALANTVNEAAEVVSDVVRSLTKAATSTAGAIADMAVSYTGPTVDLVLEPHLILDANASYADTQFKKGPIWIRIEMPPDESQMCTHALHLYSDSGEYDVTHPISDMTEQDEGTVRILFENAPMNACFTLEVILSEGKTRLVFSGVPYGSLRKTRPRYMQT